MIQTLCYLLETLLTPENTPPDTAKDIYELYFVFAAIWAFGGFLFKDEVCLAFSSQITSLKYIKKISVSSLFVFFTYILYE